jgi:SepF-like predicted cell division protein (DUF552 family)
MMKMPELFKEKEGEYTELMPEVEESQYVKIMIEKLDKYSSVDRIIRKIKDGNIVIAKIKELKENNEEELKHSITKIRTACESLNGDIAGVGEEWIIVTPNIANISRESY